MKNHTGFKLLLVMILNLGIFLIVSLAIFWPVSTILNMTGNSNYLGHALIISFIISYFITKKINVSKYI